MRGRFKSPVTYAPALARNVASLRGGVKGAQKSRNLSPQPLKEGGTAMATKKPFPFEKSSKDKEPKGMKEGSKKEEAFDKKQMGFAKGGFTSKADGVAQRGKTKATQITMKKGGKC